jgi:parvulin-like peptidyl-prolyl isomerase
MPPEMLQPALKMKAGDMSGLIQVGPNYVIFRMNKHVPAGVTPFEQVKPALRKQMEAHKTEQVRTALDQRLRQSATVETL